MKKNKGLVGKALILPIIASAIVSLNSCTKKDATPVSEVTPVSAYNTSRSQEVNYEVRKLVVAGMQQYFNGLRGNKAGNGNNSNSGNTSGAVTFANPAGNTKVSGYGSSPSNFKTYGTPSGNVSTWVDSCSFATFTVTEASSTSGLGHISIDGKNYDYNYVLSVNASNADASSPWNKFFKGRDLTGLVAFKGQSATGGDFNIEHIAAMLVSADSKGGTCNFLDFSKPSVANTDAIGSFVDLSNLFACPLKDLLKLDWTVGLNYVSSGGTVQATKETFTMGADAKVADVIWGKEVPISGIISVR